MDGCGLCNAAARPGKCDKGVGQMLKSTRKEIPADFSEAEEWLYKPRLTKRKQNPKIILHQT